MRRPKPHRLLAALPLLWATVSAAAQDGARPPGELYPVADTVIHMLCIGTGRPAVVLESGLGGNYLDWLYVQSRLAPKREVCSYDRAGAGWSGRALRSRTAEVMAEDLHLAVGAAKLPVPFVLVGHSFGGLLAQNYLARYPDEVAGLVLVDSMHPEQFARFADAGVELPTNPHQVLGATPSAASAYGLPDAVRPLAIDLATAAKARTSVLREMTAMPQIAAEVDLAPRPARPARVLVHGNREWDGRYPDGRMEAAWLAMQEDLAGRFGAPQPTVVPGSGHQIAMDAPAAVVDAIEAVSRAAADRSR